MRISVLSILGALLLGLTPWAAAGQESASQPRLALLIANQKYEPAVGILKNSKRDIDLVESALVRIGFPQENVVKEVDLDAPKLLKAVRDHINRVKAAGPGALSVVYYAGHGVAAPKNASGASGTNYLLPVDLDTTARPDIWQRAVALEDISKLLSEANEATHLVFFDACRKELILPTRGTRGFEPVMVSRGVNMLIAFATSPDESAYDSYRSGDNGPYALAFSQEVVKPGIDHPNLFWNIRTTVMNLTYSSQVPWWNDGLMKRLVLAARPKPNSNPAEGSGGADNCEVSLVRTEEVPIAWTEVPDKARVRFKAYAYTYEQPRTDARRVEEVEPGVTHRATAGTKIFAGTQGGEVAWYRYQRDVGSARQRYVVSQDAELR